MTLTERFALTARIAACVVAGSLAGFLAWAIGALGLGSVVWAAPLLVVVMLFFGLPSFGLLLAVGMVFARSIRRNTELWCLGLPIAAMLGWRGMERHAIAPADGMLLVALCAVASSALFFAWSRYRPAARAAA